MPRKKTLEKYIDEKIKILKCQFCIPLTFYEIEYFYRLETKNDVDRFAHKIIMDKLCYRFTSRNSTRIRTNGCGHNEQKTEEGK